MRRDRERGGAGRGQMEGRETERRAFAFRLISTTPASIGDRERQRERRVRGVARHRVSHNRRQNAPPQPSPAERCRSALPAAAALLPPAAAPPRVLSVCCPERLPVAAEVGTAA